MANQVKRAGQAQSSAVVVEETEPTVGIICIDNGGFNTKIFSQDMEYPVVIDSKKAFGHNNYNNFGSSSNYPEGTYKIKWKGKYYFFGLLALRSRNQLSGYTATKSTDYFILSVLQACALYGYDINYIMTSTPYLRYSEEEQELINSRLRGDHELEINNKEYKFTIAESVVAPEALIASYAVKKQGIHRWLDLGSRTVGYASTQVHGDFFESVGGDSCGTIEKEGLDIRKVLEDKEGDELREFLSEYVENIYNYLSPIWEDNDNITAFGGGALVPELVEELQFRYPNLLPDEDPLTLQVRGMMAYALTPEVYGSEEEYDEEN
ncbi:hypothetical protein M5X00_26490 [Paenibacillus alvei]|uniref:ParM/StbA family protein n=1 Tax=Paenibacillus alvei TaxID=44250 RepID=UPI0002884E2B|nr:hypothetical protein [Paenibacillus alvei]EJW14043.1 hypothetical protein PAV_141p01490 [Paenibacillus alvei DSM 29]MCY9544901.1 hypothetical protein [Paenibacillus alvei]MCY9707802.1 hypothetical protein [Paenibacillus alvei]MCY9757782.1 hypothetical protein [Paenibacillus alvei]MEC0082685.1 hypothetical protein [Paenibacillus alvei]